MKWLANILSRFLQRESGNAEMGRIIEGTIRSLLIQGSSVVLLFACNLIMTRWAGADVYGQYVHVFNWISLLSVAAVGGREDLAVSEIPKFKLSKRYDRIISMVRISNRHILIAATIAGLIFLSVIYFFPVKMLHEYRTEFLVGWAAIYFSAFFSLNQSVLQALNFIGLSQFVEKWLKPALMIIFFITAYALGVQAQGRILIGLVVLAMGICCIVLGLLVKGKIKSFPSSAARSQGDGVVGKNLNGKAFYFFLITVMTLLITRISMLVLPYFTPRKDVGIFNIGYRFADLIIYPFFLMHAVLPQTFARHTGSDASHKQSLYSGTTKLMLTLTLPLLIINILGGKFFLGWFGKDFEDGYPVLIILSVAQCLYSFFGPGNTILMMQGRERQATICLVIYVAVLFGMCLLLIPKMGITGGAISMLIGCLIYNIVLSVIVYRFSGVISPFLAFLVRAR